MPVPQFVKDELQKISKREEKCVRCHHMRQIHPPFKAYKCNHRDLTASTTTHCDCPKFLGQHDACPGCRRRIYTLGGCLVCGWTLESEET